jgi:hypothetical protein
MLLPPGEKRNNFLFVSFQENLTKFEGSEEKELIIDEL